MHLRVRLFEPFPWHTLVVADDPPGTRCLSAHTPAGPSSMPAPSRWKRDRGRCRDRSSYLGRDQHRHSLQGNALCGPTHAEGAWSRNSRIASAGYVFAVPPQAILPRSVWLRSWGPAGLFAAPFSSRFACLARVLHSATPTPSTASAFRGSGHHDIFRKPYL